MKPIATASGLGPVARAVLLGLFGLLSVSPMLASVTGWQPGGTASENRVLAEAPGPPGTAAALLAFPARLSAYLGDRYGLRTLLVGLDGRLRFGLFGEFVSDQVVMGRHGRLFFTSHTANAPFSLIDRICGTSANPAQLGQVATGLGHLLDEGRAVAPRVYYIAVPTTPVIDGDDLPLWLARRCAATTPFVPRLATALAAARPELTHGLVYPVTTIDGAKAEGTPYPIWNFHWSGLGARATAEFVGSDVLGLPRRVVLHDTVVSEPSDLAQFTPGINHRDLVPFPDHAAAGVAFCYGGGGACDAGLAPFGHAINEITTSAWSGGGGPRLLVVSDSFGRMPAQYWSEYFGTVLHLNIAWERLTPGEEHRLAAAVAAQGRPDVLLFVFHDAAASDAGGLAGPFASFAAAFR